MASWDDFRSAVRVARSRQRMTVGDDELDAFEARHNFQLPASYRAFAKEFGRCELGTAPWKVAVPGFVGDDDALDLDRIVEEMRGVVALDVEGIPGQVPGHDSGLAPRIVFFAIDVGGDYYGWDRANVTDPSGPEYAIYARTPSYERVASSFGDFLLSYALGEDLARWSEAGEPGAGAEFEPGEDPRIFLDPM